MNDKNKMLRTSGKKFKKNLVRNFSVETSQWPSILGWVRTALELDALKNSCTFYERKISGRVEEKDQAAISNLLAKYSKKMIVTTKSFCTDDIDDVDAGYVDLTSKRPSCANNTQGYFLFREKDIALSCNIAYGSGAISEISVFGYNLDKFNSIIDDFNPLFQSEYTQDENVYILETTRNGIDITLLGRGGVPYIKDNYTEEVNKQYKYLEKEISARVPNGRLFIMSGPPGTGKSFLIRGLINSIKNCIFVLVPSSQIGQLTDISIMPALKNLHAEEQKPIIFILEDADNALLPRGTDNMSIISDLLNFTDGIVGSIVDVRILATTNAKNIKIEKALMRSGRLGCDLEVKALPANDANKVLRRLTEGNLPDDKQKTSELFGYGMPATLADVYAKAKQLNEVKQLQKKVVK